jgi:hypothetical protein
MGFKHPYEVLRTLTAAIVDWAPSFPALVRNLAGAQNLRLLPCMRAFVITYEYSVLLGTYEVRSSSILRTYSARST